MSFRKQKTSWSFDIHISTQVANLKDNIPVELILMQCHKYIFQWKDKYLLNVS